MDLKLMDPQITLKLLEGRCDVITPLAQERERFYENQVCPRCGGTELAKTGDSHTLFRGKDPLPKYFLRCRNCECTFDPHSGILLSMGNVGKAFVPAVPLLDGPED